MEVKQLRGHEVALTNDWRFEVTGPLVNGETFMSFMEAEGAIKRAEDAAAMQKKAEATIAILAYDDKGVPVVIRGIHSGHGDLLGVPKDCRSVYPQFPFLKEALVRRRTLLEELEKLNQIISPFNVGVRQSYGHIKAADYAKAVEKFQAEFDRVKARAAARQEKA